jgi:hypothetical protein
MESWRSVGGPFLLDICLDRRHDLSGTSMARKSNPIIALHLILSQLIGFLLCLLLPTNQLLLGP